jgi:hypothetical protein
VSDRRDGIRSSSRSASTKAGALLNECPVWGATSSNVNGEEGREADLARRSAGFCSWRFAEHELNVAAGHDSFAS